MFHILLQTNYKFLKWFCKKKWKINKTIDSEEIRTLASEEIGALNQRLRPLGHTTSMEE